VMGGKVSDEIRDEDLVKQIKLFKGLLWGKISPTDIDVFLEFGDKLYIFIELKYGESILGWGQQKAFERICDTCATKDRVSIFLLANHWCEKDEKIVVKDCIVQKYRLNGKWSDPKQEINVKEAVDALLRKYKP